MIFAIDFDGTLVEHAFPAIGKPLPGAVDTVKALIAAGHRVIIWTCRKGVHELEAREWLRDNGINYEKFNENPPDVVDMLSGSTRKVFAHVYIDDRSFPAFTGWDEVRKKFLEEVKP